MAPFVKDVHSLAEKLLFKKVEASLFQFKTKLIVNIYHSFEVINLPKYKDILRHKPIKYYILSRFPLWGTISRWRYKYWKRNVYATNYKNPFTSLYRMHLLSKGLRTYFNWERQIISYFFFNYRERQYQWKHYLTNLTNVILY